MTDIEQIREKFDEWEANIDGDEIAEKFKKSSFVDFDGFLLFEAYQQGQRDLLEAMQPYAHQIIQKDGRQWIYTNAQAGKKYLDDMRAIGHTVRALAFVPEVGE